MEGGPRRRWPLAVLPLLLATPVAASIYVLQSRDPGSAGATVQAMAAVLALAGPAALWLMQWRRPAADTTDTAVLDRAANALCMQVRRDWERTAREWRLVYPAPIPVRWRWSELPLTGPPAEAVGVAGGGRRFPPLPGMAPVTSDRIRHGRIADLLPIYGGLDSGRLVVAGGPGAGKTAAGIRLLLDIIAHREGLPDGERGGVPVPVLLTLHGWDPVRRRLVDWLAGRLADQYSLLRAREYGPRAAARLIDGGRLSVILDGFDELPAPLRRVVLRALNEQAGFRIVLLTRGAEMVAAAAGGHLSGAAALELTSVDPADAADYLVRCQVEPLPGPWRPLVEAIRAGPHTAVAQALDTPLMLTLLRDTYQADDPVDRLLDPGRFPTRQAVEEHLLDQVLPAAYRTRPGEPEPRYDHEEARRWLSLLAHRMNGYGTRDLAWWRIPDWTRRRPRVLATGLARITVYETVGGIGGALTGGLVGGLIAGAVFGIVFGPLCGRVLGRSEHPRRLGRLRAGKVFGPEALLGGLVAGLGGGLAIQLAVGLGGGLEGGLVVGLGGAVAAGLTAGICAALAGMLAVAFGQPSASPDSPMDPVSCWRRDRDYGVMVVVLLGLGGGLAIGLAGRLPSEYAVGSTGLGGVIGGVVGGAVIGLTYSKTWPATLAFAQLWRLHRTPPRLLRFLRDAHARQVLRTVGPVYQFRHARLHDRLAAEYAADRPPGP